MDIDKLPYEVSWMSKEVAAELQKIEEEAQKHIQEKAAFAKQHGLVALLLKDEHVRKSSGEIEVNLHHCWYRTKEKFHKGDRVLLVKSSCTATGLVLQLSRHADRFDWHHPHLPSNLHWYCKLIGKVKVPGNRD